MPKPPEYSPKIYKQYRPVYPSTLFQIIYENIKNYDLAVDVGCGTGQTTKVLMEKFKRVVGIDPSKEMLNGAESGPEYQQGTAESLATLFSPSSIDLITCSTAAHWFVMEDFYRNCHLALKDNGILAIWGYGHFYCPDYPEISKICVEFSNVDMKDYWDSRRPRLDRMYSDPDFLTSPFKELKRVCYDDVDQECLMKFDWTVDQIEGYLSTWSPYKTWLSKHSQDDIPDPVKERIKQMRDIVKGTFPIKVCFPIVLITCKK